MADFLTVKDAAEKTGKSTSSIRRIIYPIVKDDQHPDRAQVQPSPEEARELRIKGENFPWRLSQELLDREITEKQPPSSGSSAASAGDNAPLVELNVLLRDQLEKAQTQLQVKDQQIATLSDLTKSLTERLHEGNVLMGTLQRQLAIPEVAARPPSDKKPSKPQEAAVASAQKAPKPAPPKKAKAKRGLWSRMFG